jgi:hypothetical protein
MIFEGHPAIVWKCCLESVKGNIASELMTSIGFVFFGQIPDQMKLKY